MRLDKAFILREKSVTILLLKKKLFNSDDKENKPSLKVCVKTYILYFYIFVLKYKQVYKNTQYIKKNVYYRITTEKNKEKI